MKDKIEDQNRRMDRIIEWVKTCDTKTSIMMSVLLLVPTFTIGTDWVLSKLEDITSIIVEAIKNDGIGYCFSVINFIVLILLLVTMIFTIISFCYFMSVLKAKTKENTYGDDVKTNSLIYFNNISSVSLETYKQLSHNEQESDYYEDLLSQTYINAKRCAEKFDYYKKGLRWLGAALISLIMFILMLFFVQI